MKTDTSDPSPTRSEEIELKLALPHYEGDDLAERLRACAPMARRKATTQTLFNIYFDTPAQDLRKKRIALRIRRIDAVSGPVWIQTLKTGARSASALSQRGEWEAQVPGEALCLEALGATPWREIDPDGSLFRELAPCFVTQFERTSWTVRAKDQSQVEVAFDRGQIEAGDLRAPLCELELELLAGEASVLFDLAHRISHTVAVLPASISKAERGYALAAGTLDMPVRSRPPPLTSHQTVMGVCQQILREMFSQFTRNLDTLQQTDHAEVVHQARIGWRRFKSALRLFKPALTLIPLPDMRPLQPLLSALGRLRDLDVALAETIPRVADVYTPTDESRKLHCHMLEQQLLDAADLQRRAVRAALQATQVGTTLLGMTRFIEALTLAVGAAKPASSGPLKPWVQRRLFKLHQKLDQSLAADSDQEAQHRARILAKRLRYGLESMQSILSRRRLTRWLDQATALQGSIGVSRDFERLHQFAVEFGAEPCLVNFLWGYACGMDHRRQ